MHILWWPLEQPFQLLLLLMLLKLLQLLMSALIQLLLEMHLRPPLLLRMLRRLLLWLLLLLLLLRLWLPLLLHLLLLPRLSLSLRRQLPLWTTLFFFFPLFLVVLPLLLLDGVEPDGPWRPSLNLRGLDPLIHGTKLVADSDGVAHSP